MLWSSPCLRVFLMNKVLTSLDTLLISTTPCVTSMTPLRRLHWENRILWLYQYSFIPTRIKRSTRCFRVFCIVLLRYLEPIPPGFFPLTTQSTTKLFHNLIGYIQNSIQSIRSCDVLTNQMFVYSLVETIPRLHDQETHSWSKTFRILTFSLPNCIFFSLLPIL